MPRNYSVRVFLAVVTLLTPFAATIADEKKPASDDAATKEPLEGHSLHGEVFNEGPRQAAYLMQGVGTIRFDVTTESAEAGAFVRQGIGQMHGFWYFESERSFRQAAMLDPDCAIAYWGMAYSNRRNSDRAKGFIKEAMTRKDKASAREQRYIEAFDRYLKAKSGTSDEKKKRAEKYISDLEELLFEFPDDVEAKAFLCEYLWSARREGLKITSYLTVDALIQDVLDVEPLHPVHHYRIHLWDTKKAAKALESAARCGLAAPQIAHMWHMPGHIYSRLKRYHDAVYQQEASARVDHAHMMKDLVLPDQIHNFAHNNEWCIRNLVHIGRVNDAIALAQNMMSLPRHPKYNHIGKSGSFKYGRQRLLDVLRAYELHDQLITLCQTPYLEECGNGTEDLKRNRYLAAALATTGNPEKATAIRQDIQTLLDKEKKKQKEAGDKAQKEAEKAKKNEKDVKKARSTAEGKHRSRVRDLEKAVQEIDGRIAAAEGKFEEALELFKKAGGVPVEDQVAVMLQAGKTDDAVKKIASHVGSNRSEVRPLASQVETLWAAKKKDEAKKAFEQLRKISSTIDPDVPSFARLKPIAMELGFGNDWRTGAVVASDIGARPPLNSLGPLHWRPVAASDWSLSDVENQPRTLSDYRGKPVVMIFYLGFGCLHCAEQLQKFAPEMEKFQTAGLDVIAVSTDKQDVLGRAYEDLDDGFPFPLVSDAELDVFKSYRCYDDFENLPLHGTFLIDGKGRIRWQDISYEPFMDPDFVLKEAQRLLGQDATVSTPLSEQVTSTR
ncbi:MAG: redoxin domain-containing protein [Fuerstiella sp.]